MTNSRWLIALVCAGCGSSGGTGGADDLSMAGAIDMAMSSSADLRTSSDGAMGSVLELRVSFDSVSGMQINDESGKAHHGTMSGAAAVVAGGKTGNALSLSGTAADTKVSFGDVAPFGGAITLEAWLKPTGAQSPWAAVISRWNTANGYWLGASSPAGKWEIYIGSTAMISNAALVSDAWQHVAASYDSSSGMAILYLNGVVDKSAAQSTTTAGPADLHLGGNASGANYSGLVDDVRIYSGARTQAEICQDAGGTPGGGGACTIP